MRVFLIFLALISFAWAQSETEEALILNQELQFLEDAASAVGNSVAETPATTASPVGEQATRESLEREYFSDAEQDAVRTRSAAPKRRSF